VYGWTAAAISPFIRLLANWEKKRGTVPLMRVMDVHYTWSIRYHIFLGYRRYAKDQRTVRQKIATPIQPPLAKEYPIKAKGELSKSR
jgi:hypothetical protein